MSAELYWLALTATMTALFFLPYVLNRISIRGLFGAMSNPRQGDLPESDWAQRAMKAHANAVENLVVFGVLVLCAQAAGVSTAMTAFAGCLYFWARLVHYLVYTLGVPIARTLAFFAGFAAQLIVAFELLAAF
ncbi:MAG: MAPEG family protein [Pseudomonadota bacterium]|nr:MAPEG family protein [Pseudomonadota bacterium]